MSEESIPRHELWRRQYNADRYARHLSQPELDRRIRDVFLNVIHLTSKAQIDFGPIKIEPGAVSNASTFWMETWTHVLEEMKLRHGPYPTGFQRREILHSEPLPDLVSELGKKAAARLSSMGLRRGDVFIKFGKRAHMEALHEVGAPRIQPATFFAKADHNGAVRDDELRFRLSIVLSRDQMVKLVTNPQDVPTDAPEQRVDVGIQLPTDYWLYCVTNSVEPRLFVDFEADSCVIIRERTKFSSMLAKASRHQLSGIVMRQGPAMYVDPLRPTTANLFVPLIKHFGHTYQDEHRFFRLPAAPAPKLSHVDVQIGSLKEFSDFVVL